MYDMCHDMLVVKVGAKAKSNKDLFACMFNGDPCANPLKLIKFKYEADKEEKWAQPIVVPMSSPDEGDMLCNAFMIDDRILIVTIKYLTVFTCDLK